MKYAKIFYNNTANGKGVRTVLFVSGCRNHCKDCFQPETWDFNYGEEFTEETEKELIDSLAPEYITGITLLGGDPFEEENQRRLLPFVKKLKEIYPNKNIWSYTGYIYDKDLIENGRKHIEVTDELISLIDVLVDGPFILEKKSLMLKYKGSSNQRVINIKETLKNNKVIEIE